MDTSLLATWSAVVISALAIIVSLYVYWDSTVPDVHAYLEMDRDKGALGIVVCNFGKRPAYDIEILGFDDRLVQKDLLSGVAKSFVKNGIPMLAPGQSCSTIIADLSYAVEHISGLKCQGEIAYRKKSGFPLRKRMSNSFVLDYSSFAHSLYVKSDIHEISESLGKIADSLS